MTGCTRRRRHRPGTAAVEFAVCLPLMLLLIFGLWEVGRMTQVYNVMWNAARESARDASIGQDNLLSVANNTLAYLQAAEPDGFGSGHSTSMISPVISLPAGTYGYTCWDNTANRELFTITFTDITNTKVTDPTGMAQLDHYRIAVQTHYASIGWLPVAQLTGTTRLSVRVDWACMVDSPFQISPYLPAQ